MPSTTAMKFCKISFLWPFLRFLKCVSMSLWATDMVDMIVDGCAFRLFYDMISTREKGVLLLFFKANRNSRGNEQ